MKLVINQVIGTLKKNNVAADWLLGKHHTEAV
jgi:hypothetical protein